MQGRAAHRRWLLLSSLTGLGLIGWFLFQPISARGPLVFWSLGTYSLLVAALARPIRPADVVSAARVVLAGSAALVGDAAVLQASLFALAIASDALDGLLARCFGPSAHGEVLDMEADQLLVLMLAISVSPNNLPGDVPGTALGAALGAVALLLPALKYLFTLAEMMLGLSAGVAKPVRGDNRRARLIYLLVLGALVSGLPLLQGTPYPLFQLLLALAFVLLSLSFIADLRHKRLVARVSAP